MTTEPKSYRVLYREDEDTPPETVGTMTIDALCRIDNVVATGDYADDLSEAVEELNAKESFDIRIPPPAPTEKFQLWKQAIERDAPAAFDALRENLNDKYGFEIEAI